MGQEVKIPDAFKNRAMSSAFATQLNAQEDNLSEGIGQSYAVIGYKGKVWSLRYRGERKTIIRPDDGTPCGYLDVIILGKGKQKSKSYYKEYDPASSDGERPICASMDGVVPDLDVLDKQCESCALCPRNVWKTNPATGRKGRDCTDYMRLAVLILPTQTEPILGSPLLEPVFLRVPPDSLNSLANMGDNMSAQGYHPSSYITRITFDPQKAHPCMEFRPLQPLSDQEAPVILDIRKDPLVNRITGAELALQGAQAVQRAVTHSAGAAGQSGAQSPAPSQPPAAAPSLTELSGGGGVPTSTAPVITSSKSGLDGALLATHAPDTLREHGQTQPTAGSIGGVNGVLGTPTPSTVFQTVSDAGEPEASDEDLDSLIAQAVAHPSA